MAKEAVLMADFYVAMRAYMFLSAVALEKIIDLVLAEGVGVHFVAEAAIKLLHEEVAEVQLAIDCEMWVRHHARLYLSIINALYDLH